jgi:uroporphyrinogen-III synthase
VLAMSLLQDVRDKHIAIVCGEGGRTVLADTLFERGAKVTVLTVYRRQLPVVDAKPMIEKVNTHQVDVLVCTSLESVQNLHVLIPSPRLYELTMIVVSERIAHRARELGFKHIKIAKNASHSALLATLKECVWQTK